MWRLSSLHTPSLSLCRAGAVLHRFHHISKSMNQDCLCGSFLIHGLRWRCLKNPDLVLVRAASSVVSSSLSNANELRINIRMCFTGCKNQVCTNMRNSLTAELNCMGGKESIMLWRWHLGWKAVIKLLLRTVKDYFHFCLLACCTKQQKKLSHVSLYWWTLKANFILKLNWGFSAGNVFVCVIRHRKTIQFWNVFACDSTEMLETLA